MNNFIVSMVKMIWKIVNNPIVKEKLKKLLWWLIIAIVNQAKDEQQKTQQAKG